MLRSAEDKSVWGGVVFLATNFAEATSRVTIQIAFFRAKHTKAGADRSKEDEEDRVSDWLTLPIRWPSK